MQKDSNVNKKDIDPRKSLESFYNLTQIENIPLGIVEKSFNINNENDLSGTKNEQDLDDNEILTKEIIANIFEDPRITLEQREYISKSILHNKIKIVDAKQSKAKPYLISKGHEKQRVAKLTSIRHKLQKPRFLNLEATSIDIPAISNKDLHIQKMNFLRSQYQSRSIGNLKSVLSNQVHYNASRTIDDMSATAITTTAQVKESFEEELKHNDITDDTMNNDNHYDPYDNITKQQQPQKQYPPFLVMDDSKFNTPYTTRPHTTTTQDTTTMRPSSAARNKKSFTHNEETNLKEIQVKLLAEHKRKLLEDSKLFSEQKRNESLELKRQEQLITVKKMQIKKKLNEFRKKLHQYLIETKNPMVGTIMRCVDESMVYHFMQTYQGFAMSVEAILAILGNALGTSIVNPHIPSATLGDDDLIKLQTTDMNGMNNGIFQEHKQGVENPFGTLFRTGSKLQLPPLEFQETNRVSTGFGSRGLSSRERTQTNGHSNNTNTNLHDDDDDMTYNYHMVNDDTVKQHHLLGNQSDPVRGIKNTKYRPNTKPTLPNSKTLGSGYRILKPHSNNEPDYIPSHRAISPINMSLQSILHNPRKLVIFGSENLRTVAQEMGFEYQVQEGLKRLGIQTSNDSDETMRAINAVHQQLMEESQLPSMLPEKVLSDKQIEDLGAHKKSFDRILKEVKRNKSASSLTSTIISSVENKNYLPRSQFPQLNSFILEDDNSPQPSFLINNPQILIDNENNIMDDSIYKSQVLEDTILYDIEQHQQQKEQDGNDEEEDKSVISVDSFTITKEVGSPPRDNSFRISTVQSTESLQNPTSESVDDFKIPIVSNSAGLLSHLKHTGDPDDIKQYHTGLYGTILQSTDRMRLQQLSELEIERGKVRLGIEAIAPSHEDILKKNKLSRIPSSTLGAAPKGIKTNPSIDPMNPFKSHTEETMVMNAGVASGAGLMLWRPKKNVSKNGRYRMGIIKGVNSNSPNKHNIDLNYKKPFIPSV